MNMHFRSYSAELADHYAQVRARLGGLPLARPVPLLPPPAWAEPHSVVDLVPDQRGRVVVPIDANAEIIAARRALMIFVRLRSDEPGLNSVRHIQVAVASAFKIDMPELLGRSRRHGPTRIRQIAMVLAMRVCKLARSQVAIRFDRNHATVHHAEKKLVAFLDGTTSQIGGADE